jgi:hypothetical protein
MMPFYFWLVPTTRKRHSHVLVPRSAAKEEEQQMKMFLLPLLLSSFSKMNSDDRNWCSKDLYCRFRISLKSLHSPYIIVSQQRWLSKLFCVNGIPSDDVCHGYAYTWKFERWLLRAYATSFAQSTIGRSTSKELKSEDCSNTVNYTTLLVLSFSICRLFIQRPIKISFPFQDQSRLGITAIQILLHDTLETPIYIYFSYLGVTGISYFPEKILPSHLSPIGSNDSSHPDTPSQA